MFQLKANVVTEKDTVGIKTDLLLFRATHYHYCLSSIYSKTDQEKSKRGNVGGKSTANLLETSRKAAVIVIILQGLLQSGGTWLSLQEIETRARGQPRLGGNVSINPQ